MEWLDPWKPIPEPTFARNMELELARELPGDHPLAGVPVAAIGVGWHGDDILFRLLDGSNRLAAVHLTWGSATEAMPLPWTTIYSDEADWLIRGLRADHGEHRELLGRA